MILLILIPYHYIHIFSPIQLPTLLLGKCFQYIEIKLIAIKLIFQNNYKMFLPR